MRTSWWNSWMGCIGRFCVLATSRTPSLSSSPLSSLAVPELSCFGFGGECSQFQVALLGGDTNRAELHRGLGRWIPYQAGKIQYDSYRPNHVAAVRELRDLLYKVRSLKKLVVRLKEGNLEWESGEEAVRLCQPKFSWKSLNTHGLPSLRSTRVIPRVSVEPLSFWLAELVKAHSSGVSPRVSFSEIPLLFFFLLLFYFPISLHGRV